MFLGTHQPRLDEKGRLFLPAKFRDELKDGLVLTKGQENCVYGWPLPEWERITEQMRSLPITGKSARDLTRVLFASGSLEVPDKQGRITVPTALREYAGMERDCVVIGANTRVEFWDQGAWDNYLTAAEPAYADMAEEVLPGVM